MELREINFESKTFDCGGRKFFVRESLSFARYRELQKISLEFGFSSTFSSVYNNLTDAVDFYNKMKYFDMSIIIYKILEGIKTIEDKDDPALRLCALFIDEEKEDPTIYDEAKLKEKVDCWGKELGVSFFFHMAANLVLGWMPVYEMHIRNGLQEIQKNEEKPEAQNQ